MARPLCMVAFSRSTAQQLQFRVGPGYSFISPPSEDEESKISREFRREAKKFLKFPSNPEVERYIDRIGRRILAATGPLSFDYRFFVVETTSSTHFPFPADQSTQTPD